MYLDTLEIERHLIGILLFYADSVHSIRDFITPAHFSNSSLSEIYSVINDLAAEGSPVERAIVVRRCSVAPPGVALPVYLAQLYSDAPEESKLPALAKELHDANMRRSARKLFQSAHDAMGKVPDVRAALQATQGEIAQILSSTRTTGGSIGALAQRVINENWSPATERPRTLLSGLEFVDRIVGPMGAGNLAILGGSTSAGKSALAAQIAVSVAKRALVEDKDLPGARLGVPVLYVTLEMSETEISGRLLAQESQTPLWKIEQNELNSAEQTIVFDAQRAISQVPLYIEDLPRATVAGILALVMKAQKLWDVGFVVVDHLHYIRGSNKRADRFAQIEEVVMDLKAAAKQTNLPWLCISHLSRDVAKRPDKRPHLSDLYGASEIEKSADVVFFVHREAYWLARDKPRQGAKEYDEWHRQMFGAGGTEEWPGADALVNRAEIIVEKRRKGKGVATCMCEFDEKLTMFR